MEETTPKPPLFSLEFWKTIDRRWIFLLMFLSVSIPILMELTFPEQATGLARTTFDEIEAVPENGRVLMAFDYDPASEGELGPMATAFTRHAAERGLRMYFMTLWPVGPQMIDEAISRVITADFPHLTYGEDYVNLGFKSGNESVIRSISTNLRGLFPTDSFGRNIDQLPMMDGIRNVRDFDLIINVSAGYAGTKEWVQYAVTPYPDDVRLVAGCTGVQAPLLYPYIPTQLPGLLGAIKGAAEYEALVLEKYGKRDPATGELAEPGKYLEGRRRMGPQLIAHVLMILLIVAGNIIYFIERRRGAAQ